MGEVAIALATAPLRRFLDEHARPPTPASVNVVVLPRIAAEGSLAEASLVSFEGLTLAPGLAGKLTRALPAQQLRAALGELPPRGAALVGRHPLAPPRGPSPGRTRSATPSACRTSGRSGT